MYVCLEPKAAKRRGRKEGGKNENMEMKKSVGQTNIAGECYKSGGNNDCMLQYSRVQVH